MSNLIKANSITTFIFRTWLRQFLCRKVRIDPGFQLAKPLSCMQASFQITYFRKYIARLIRIYIKYSRTCIFIQTVFYVLLLELTNDVLNTWLSLIEKLKIKSPLDNLTDIIMIFFYIYSLLNICVSDDNGYFLPVPSFFFLYC